MRPVPIRRLIILSAALMILALTAFRLIPRLVPWKGGPALKAITWSHRILDRNGETLQIRPVNDDGLRRIFVPLDEIPRALRSIVRQSEDRRFYLHPGFDPLSLARAAIRSAGRSAGGGSTISMQLARIILPRSPGAEITPGLKMREIWQALQIESRFSKREILELYINLVPFGRNIEGYPAAAGLFFNRSLAELSPEEVCLLAVIPRAPGRFDPLLEPDENIRAAGKLAEKALGKAESVDFSRKARERLLSEAASWPFEAPHFIEKIMNGRESWSVEKRNGREPIMSTLDLSMQREAGKLLKFHVDMAGAYRIGNGAMILADPKTMDVRVYLGSADFHDAERSGQIDGISMLREPGSTLKPLLYAEALENGWTASTILPDIPMEFGGEFLYAPRNYNEQFHGPLRLRQALAASLNIPAVYTLERLGVDRFTETLISAGFESLVDQKGNLGVSLAVGGGEVSLAELIQGYGVLYAGGMARPLRYIAGSAGEGMRIWSPETTDIITDIISSRDDRVMTFGRGGPVRFDYPAAIKTGTSNQFNNIWAVGFTSDLIGAVWMGNFDGTTVQAAPGSSLPATVLHEAFDAWSSRGDLPRYSEPEPRSICSLSGMEATALCPYTVEEIFAFGTAPPPCSWHISSPAGGPGTVRYPQEYAYWAERYGYDLEFSGGSGPEILSPGEGAVYYRPGSILIRLGGSGPASLRADGRLLFEGELPAELFWTLVPGHITFALEQGEMPVIRRIEVR